jgi:hypothetical protein
LDCATQRLYRELVERRSNLRYPFFCPATLELEPGCRRLHSVFTRDLSRAGVGLLHNMPLPLQTAHLTISPENRDATLLPIALQWCRPCGDGWYVSGAMFLEMID